MEYSAYPLAAMEFAKKFKDDFKFTITQVIGLTNDDEVSKEFRPYKQMIEPFSIAPTKFPTELPMVLIIMKVPITI